MVRLFNPTCPKCKGVFHVHHDDLRHLHVKLHCPYCAEDFFLEQSPAVVEHDGASWNPARENSAKSRA